MGIAIGIDLGTTNTVCAFVDGSKPTIIPNSEGNRLTPSAVCYRDGQRTVGKAAKRQIQLYPENTIHSIKRFIGRRYQESVPDFRLVNYIIERAPDDDCIVRVDGRTYTAQEISAIILREIKIYAEDHLGETITDAVITVPAYFNDRQRQATKDAGALAGLDILRVINEPTAAALAYTYSQKGKQRIAVYDFGGGTFDVSVLDLDRDVAEVLSTRGDNTLGGNDIDLALEEWILENFEKENNVNLRNDLVAMQRIHDEAERVKIDLSTSTNSIINLPFLFVDANGPKNFQRKISREEFNEMISPLIDRTIHECVLALKDANLSNSDIDEIVLVGGSSRIPLVQEKIQDLFTCKINKSFNPEEVVAIGAALQAAALSGETSKAVTLLDVTAFSLGIEIRGGKFAPLIHKNSTIPLEVSRQVTTSVDNQRTVKIHVLQGEEEHARHNVSLGKFELTNIQPAPAKTPKIKVTFAIDSNGMVQVSAKDTRTGVSEEIIIENTDGLAQSTLDKMKKRINTEHQSLDKNNQLKEIQNQIEQTLVQIDTIIHEHEGEIHRHTVKKVSDFQRRARAALQKAQDINKLKQLFSQIQRLKGDLELQLKAIQKS